MLAGIRWPVITFWWLHIFSFSCWTEINIKSSTMGMQKLRKLLIESSGRALVVSLALSCAPSHGLVSRMNLIAGPYRLLQETGHIQLQNCHASVATVSTFMVFWARRGVLGGKDYEGHKHTVLTLSLTAYSVLYAISSNNNDNNQD